MYEKVVEIDLTTIEYCSYFENDPKSITTIRKNFAIVFLFSISPTTYHPPPTMLVSVV